MIRADIDAETYDWLTQRFGERVAEGLVPCPGHAWPLTNDEQKTAHAHYERWANQQEGDMSETSMAEYEQDCKPLMPMASTLGYAPTRWRRRSPSRRQGTTDAR